MTRVNNGYSRIRCCQRHKPRKLISNDNMFVWVFEPHCSCYLYVIQILHFSLNRFLLFLLTYQVVAKETELVLRDKVQIPCRGKRHRNGEPCIQKDILYRILCLAEEAGRKYRVHLKGEK